VVGEDLQPALIAEASNVRCRLHHVGEQNRGEHPVEVTGGMAAGQELLDAVKHRRGVAREEQVARRGTRDPATTWRVLDDVLAPGPGELVAVNHQRRDGEARQDIA
jgi:hypothetical protein